MNSVVKGKQSHLTLRIRKLRDSLVREGDQKYLLQGYQLLLVDNGQEGSKKSVEIFASEQTGGIRPETETNPQFTTRFILLCCSVKLFLIRDEG